jgi:hypothetical protein
MIGRRGKRDRLFGKMCLALCTGPREDIYCQYREGSRTATPQAIVAETRNASRSRGKSKGHINRDATVGEVESGGERRWSVPDQWSLAEDLGERTRVSVPTQKK